MPDKTDKQEFWENIAGPPMDKRGCGNCLHLNDGMPCWRFDATGKEGCVLGYRKGFDADSYPHWKWNGIHE